MHYQQTLVCQTVGFLVMNEELFISKIYFLRGLFKVYRVENR